MSEDRIRHLREVGTALVESSGAAFFVTDPWDDELITIAYDMHVTYFLRPYTWTNAGVSPFATPEELEKYQTIGEQLHAAYLLLI